MSETEDTAKERVVKIACPHCQNAVSVTLSAKVTVADAAEKGIESSNGLTEAQKQLLKDARSQGLFEAFSTVVRRVKRDQVPRQMEKFFLQFFKAAAPKKVPAHMLRALILAFPGTRIEFRANEGVGVVLADGLVRAFVPQSYVMGQRVPGASGVRLRADEDGFDDWIRTRYGFVAGPGPMFQALQKRSIGEFSR